MDSSQDVIHDLISNDSYKTMPAFLDQIDFLITNVIRAEVTPIDVTDQDFVKEVTIFQHPKVSFYFGKTCKNLKCIILDKNDREHEMWLQYMGPKKLRILDTNVPRSHLQDRDYISLEEVINVFMKHIDGLYNYFEQLEELSLYCTIIDPVRPTFKENYRKVHLAPRVWLQVEVTSDGSAKNLHIVDQYKEYGDKPGKLLQAWDHNKDIPTNVMKIIGALEAESPIKDIVITEEVSQAVDVPICRICLCSELEGDTSPPQLFCSNPSCGVYLHRACLYEWLVQCCRGQRSLFGVAIGTCPNCNQVIQCNEKDT